MKTALYHGDRFAPHPRQPASSICPLSNGFPFSIGWVQAIVLTVQVALAIPSCRQRDSMIASKSSG
jgi:hypothetical protein